MKKSAASRALMARICSITTFQWRSFNRLCKYFLSLSFITARKSLLRFCGVRDGQRSLDLVRCYRNVTSGGGAIYRLEPAVL